ncbi:MAG TPA: DUF6134 family protein [Gemmataceae bacterium]|nr:DUF6134 family protein [Gemmataceae bacterium]
MVCQHGWERMIVLAFCWLAYPAAPAALGADTEQRDYAILVDGKESGQSRLTITVEADGTTVVAGTARVKINRVLFNYAFNVESTEWWKDGKLMGLKASSVENGKQTDVTAASDGVQLKLRLNGQDRAASVEAWTSSFWKLADARYHNKSIPVLEPDTGKEFIGQLQYIGTEQLTLLSQPQSCYHFRVSGGSYPIDVWFDRYHRLVRQEFTDTGHKTIVQLTAVKR